MASRRRCAAARPPSGVWWAATPASGTASLLAGTGLVRAIAFIVAPSKHEIWSQAGWPETFSAVAASGAEHDVVDVVRRGGGARRSGSLLVNLDVPFG